MNGRAPQKPSIGRIVHLVAAEGHRAAIIIKVVSDAVVELHVFSAIGDEPVADGEFTYGEAGAANTWHWPEHV